MTDETKSLARLLEKEAIALCEFMVRDSVLSLEDRATCLRAARDALDLAERIGSAESYPGVYSPLITLYGVEFNSGK